MKLLYKNPVIIEFKIRELWGTDRNLHSFLGYLTYLALCMDSSKKNPQVAEVLQFLYSTTLLVSIQKNTERSKRNFFTGTVSSIPIHTFKHKSPSSFFLISVSIPNAFATFQFPCILVFWIFFLFVFTSFSIVLCQASFSVSSFNLTQ